MGSHLATLWRYREMVANLVVRDLKVKYKGSVLGFAWSFLNPGIMILLYYLVFSLFAPGFRAEIPNYGLFLIAGMWPWMTFASASGKSAPLFILNQDLMRKVYFPREVLPISVVLAEFVNFGIGLVLFLIVLALTGTALGPHVLLLIPLTLALLSLTLGMALMVSAADVFYRDVEQILNSCLTILFFASPIVYTLKKVHDVAEGQELVGLLMPLNPLAWLIPAFRQVFLGRLDYDPFPVPLTTVVMASLGVALLFLLIVYVNFKRVEYRIVEEV
ncbi:MAG: ABC transporter permease [bacterium]